MGFWFLSCYIYFELIIIGYMLMIGGLYGFGNKGVVIFIIS